MHMKYGSDKERDIWRKREKSLNYLRLFLYTSYTAPLPWCDIHEEVKDA
jgi:hypothetical protein